MTDSELIAERLDVRQQRQHGEPPPWLPPRPELSAAMTPEQKIEALTEWVKIVDRGLREGPVIYWGGRAGEESLSSLVAALKRDMALQLRVGGGLVMKRWGNSIVIAATPQEPAPQILPRPCGFWARLTSEASGGGGYYSWKRLKDDAETDYVPATTGTDNAKETSEAAGIKVGANDGTVVWLNRDAADDEWRFAYAPGIPPGKFKYQARTWDDEEEDEWAAGWVKAHD